MRGPPPQGLWSAAPWPWRAGEQRGWADRNGMEGVEGGESGGAGLGFSLQFDPGRAGLDHRALLGVSLPALLSRLLRRGGSAVVAEEGVDSAAAAAAVSVAVLAAVSVCLAGLYAPDHQLHRRRRRRAPLRPPSAPALAPPSSGAKSAPRPRALPAPGDGLRILSSNDESLENVIHGASIGAGDDEPCIVARVEIETNINMAGAHAVGDAEAGQPEPEKKQQEELERLRELWLSLVEREQRLELRLQELQGLREQEAAVRELESRVAAAAMEARLLELRASSLQEENGRLRAQAAELDDARAELARAKEKLRAIKARVQGEQEEARREAAALRARVEELETAGKERSSALAAEVAALRTANAALEEENIELALRLQDAEQAASSVHLVQEEGMVEEAKCLREANERLTTQIEQLRSDHCAHVEELVYLKWVNACLRHELRDHGLHPPSSALHQDHDADHDAGTGGLTSAMELSKSMSFRSSERAKQLMLRYGHTGLDGFDPALFSPLHESLDGDGADDERATRPRGYEPPERSPGTSVATTVAASSAAAPGKKGAGQRKLKFLGNIKKLLPGGKRSRGGEHDAGRESRKPAPSDEYLEKAMQWLSTHDAFDVGNHSDESTPLSSCERTPLSSVTTADSRARRGSVDVGGACRETPAGAAEAAATLVRSKSDAAASYGREASRYHALRPDHPAGAMVEPDVICSPEKRQPRRRSAEQIS